LQEATTFPYPLGKNPAHSQAIGLDLYSRQTPVFFHPHPKLRSPVYLVKDDKRSQALLVNFSWLQKQAMQGSTQSEILIFHAIMN